MINKLKYMSASAVLLLASLSMSAQHSEVVAEKSRIMAERDPYGFIMLITCAGVVFVALVLLYIIYKYMGKLHTHKSADKPSSSAPIAAKTGKDGLTPETALAIAMALDKECGGETKAAIAMALHQYFNDTVHDQESFVLTIKPTFSQWASRYSTLRQLPERK